MIYNRTLKRPISIHFVLVCFVWLGIISSSCSRQDEKSRPSPLVKDSVSFDGVDIKVQYSSPSVRDRQIWGDLVPYYKVWRTGANEATIFQCSEDLLVEGQFLKEGKYAVFTIPEPESWTVIFNSDWNQWGAYGYEGTINKPGKDDVLRLKVVPESTDKFYERMEIVPEDGNLVFRWENLKFTLSLDRASPLSASH